MVWSPLAGGLLSGKFDRNSDGPEGARRTSFDFPPVDRERAFSVVDAMRPIAEAHDCSVARIAQAWLLQQPGIEHHYRRQDHDATRRTIYRRLISP